jgi:hypothetical protein
MADPSTNQKAGLDFGLNFFEEKMIQKRKK